MEHPNYFDLVCEGGGVRGIALVGALAVLEERGFEVQNLAGTSAGAIAATLRAAGYSGAELKNVIATLDFTQIMDPSWESRVPLVGQGLSVLLEHGIYRGQYFLELMQSLLERKGVRTFKDLVHPKYADDPRYRYRVQVIASDLTGRRLLALPYDAIKLGVRPDDLDVALAVRMSMSIPVFFEPVRFNNPHTNAEHMIVDGGLLSNFPVWIFDSDGPPEWPTFGLWLGESDPKRPDSPIEPAPTSRANPFASLVQYLRSLIDTATQAHDRLYLEKDTFVRTVVIPTLGIDAIDFNLSREQVEALYQSGRDAATKFLQTWDFGAYVKEFRSGKKHSRRADVTRELQQAARAAR
jgi:NTE family protein